MRSFIADKNMLHSDENKKDKLILNGCAFSMDKKDKQKEKVTQIYRDQKVV